jgi:23S rRNA (uracil1939-C5)-methyltransferase
LKKKTTLSAGARLEVEIERAVNRGMGLARHEGQVVFVPRGLPGDRLVVRVVALEKGYVRAATEERLAAGPGARGAPCPAFPGCGGCAYQTLDYSSQLVLKVEVLREALRRARVVWDGEIPMIGSPEQGWRTRASFHVAEARGQVALGLFEEGTRRVVDLRAGCPQISLGLNRILAGAREALGDSPALASRVEHLHLAESSDGSEQVLFIEGDLSPAEAGNLREALSSLPLSGLGVAIGPKNGRTLIVFSGNPYVHAEVLGVRLRAHARGFFQGNRFLVEPLARAVGDLLPRSGPILDLYSGIGLFGLTAGRDASDVVMVEASDLSVKDAEENVREHRPGSVKVMRGDVGDVLGRLPVGENERIILDPPRTGLGRGVVEAIHRRKPAVVVYVSCDPATLGRDLRAFAELGLHVDAVRALDLFPDTFHLETVARLVPR